MSEQPGALGPVVVTRTELTLLEAAHRRLLGEDPDVAAVPALRAAAITSSPPAVIAPISPVDAACARFTDSIANASCCSRAPSIDTVTPTFSATIQSMISSSSPPKGRREKRSGGVIATGPCAFLRLVFSPGVTSPSFRRAPLAAGSGRP
mgnify:CR=1 FL=1